MQLGATCIARHSLVGRACGGPMPAQRALHVHAATCPSACMCAAAAPPQTAAGRTPRPRNPASYAGPNNRLAGQVERLPLPPCVLLWWSCHSWARVAPLPMRLALPPLLPSVLLLPLRHAGACCGEWGNSMGLPPCLLPAASPERQMPHACECCGLPDCCFAHGGRHEVRCMKAEWWRCSQQQQLLLSHAASSTELLTRLD